MNELEFSREISKLYHNIIKLEERTMKNEKNRANLTVNELHLIECIRGLTKNQTGPTISAIAAELDITRPSTTVAINKLETKKYVEKSDCSEDGRSVRVKLTQKGEKAYNTHKTYHTQLLKEVKAYFTDEEYKNITDGFSKLKTFFNEKLDALKADEEF